MKSIELLISEAGAELKMHGVAEPSREARLLMEFAVLRDGAFLRAHPEFVPSGEVFDRFRDAVKRRCKREPYQHIVGFQEFYGLRFEVNPKVLIPRPETEMLVEESIALLAGSENVRLLEIGVGSGCVSISILKNVPGAEVFAVDISEDAIMVAERNARRHGVKERFETAVSNVFEHLDPTDKFDLIVSNPPYVPSDTIETLQPEVRDFEPLEALTDHDDGLGILRRIIESAPLHLIPGGSLLLEFGIYQDRAVEAMFDDNLWEAVNIESDLQSIPRIAIAQTKN